MRPKKTGPEIKKFPVQNQKVLKKIFRKQKFLETFFWTPKPHF